MQDEKSRVGSELEVQTFLQDMICALDNRAEINFRIRRKVENSRDEKYTNEYTISTLFPNENPVDALRRELKNISLEDYIKTVKDLRFPLKGDMLEFGKVYNNQDVYIKVRVNFSEESGKYIVFVMSFHFAMMPFSKDDFPYKESEEQ